MCSAILSPTNLYSIYAPTTLNFSLFPNLLFSSLRPFWAFINLYSYNIHKALSPGPTLVGSNK